VLEQAAKPFTASWVAQNFGQDPDHRKLLDKVDNLIIGGGMSYTFSRRWADRWASHWWKKTT